MVVKTGSLPPQALLGLRNKTDCAQRAQRRNSSCDLDNAISTSAFDSAFRISAIFRCFSGEHKADVECETRLIGDGEYRKHIETPYG